MRVARVDSLAIRVARNNTEFKGVHVLPVISRLEDKAKESETCIACEMHATNFSTAETPGPKTCLSNVLGLDQFQGMQKRVRANVVQTLGS